MSSFAWHRASKRSGKFLPVLHYADNGTNYRIQYGQNLNCGAFVFIDVLLAELRLREQIQAKEYLISESGALRYKDSHFDNNPPEYDNRLEDIRKRIDFLMVDLYNCESMLPGLPVKQEYHKLRKNPKWYLRKELVEDCIQKGGCCARDCGCCKKRHLNSQIIKGIGHCTVECGCCTRNRGYEFTAEDKEKLAQKTTNSLKSANPSCLIPMIEAFFSESDTIGWRSWGRKLAGLL